MTKYKNIYQSPFALTLSFIFVTILILVIGLRYFNNQKTKFKKEKYDEISAIAELKTNQLISWRTERLADAYVISEDYLFISLVKNWLLNQGDNKTQKEIERHLRLFLTYYQYKDVILLDENGAIKISLNESHKNHGDKLISYFNESAKEKKIIFGDFIKSDNDSTLELNIITPIYNGQKLIGGIILCIDPGQYLFPLIQSWPSPSKSSESLLIKREGNEAVYLNELRHRSNTALKLRFKIDSANIDIPSVAAYFGKEGLFEGIDYRGVQVLSNIKKIPGSDWILITKIDLDEIYTPINEKSFYIGIFIGLLILFFGSGTYGLWLYQKRSLWLKHLQMDNEKQALKKHFEYLVKYANDIIILSDENQLITMVNDRAIKSYGYYEDEMINMSVKGLPAEGYKESLEDMTETAKFEEGIIFESVHHRKDISNFPVEVSIRLIDIDGKKYYQRIIRDITERKKAEEEIRNSEEKYRLIVEHSPDAVIIHSDGKILYANPATIKLLNIDSVEQILDKPAIDFVHPDYKEVALKRIKEIYNTGKPSDFNEEIFLKKNNEVFDVEVIGIPVNYKGKPAIQTIVRDITERKRSEKALQESELKFNTTFRFSPVAILLTSVETGEIIDANELFLKFTGFKRNEVIGRTTIELGIYENDSDRETLLNEFQKAGYLYGYELAVRMKSGTKLSCLVSINNISVDGKPCLLSTIIDISDRKQAEKNLRRSEERFQLVARATNDIIYDWNLKKDEAWFSEAYEKLFGYTERKEKFQVWNKKIHPEDLDKTLAITNAVISGGGSIWTCEYRFRRKDDTYAFVSDRGYVIRDKNGHPVRAIGSIMDITEQKKSQEAIKKSEEKYRILIETMNEALIFVDNDDKIQFVNKSLCEMYGYNQDELLGKIGYEIIVYKDDIKIIKEKNRLRTEGVVDNYEVRGIKKSGEIIWLNISGAPIMDNDGKVIGSIGVISDITKNRQAQEELKKLSSAVEQSPTTIVITDTEGGIEYVNPKFEEITGYTFNEVKGKNPRVLKSGEKSSEEYKQLWETISSGGDWHGEFHNKRKDGTLYWESASLSPIKNNEGKITHYLAIKEDITEKKEKEHELILAKEKAEESERLKSSFLANMSHELRTPMVGILGYSEVLESQLDEGPHKKMAEAIHNSGNRLMNTLNLVLDLSRIEAGRLELECSEFNLIDTLKNSIELFEQTARKKNLFLKFEKKVSKINVFLEERLIRDAINNLLNNAIKYTDSGGVTISVEEIKENGIRKLVIDVEDTGIGIPNDEINTVFEEFRQVSEGYDRNFEGSGLGLTIVKRFIEKMNGSISVKSELGKGSTFTIRIPSILATHTTSNKPLVIKDDKMEQKEISNENQNEIKIKNSVLLVDDDETTNSLITSYLKKHYFIDAAVSEEEALTLVKQKKYNLILMDINLGRGRSGIAVTKDIKNMKDYKDVPIIAVTAFAMVGDREEFLAGGCTDYISKPFKLKDLLTMIQKYLPESIKI